MNKSTAAIPFSTPCAMALPDDPPIPPPVPPKPPVPGECCERGCEMCMWDYYHEAQRRYETAYADWRRRSGRAE